MGSEFVLGYIQAMDGEKDPRNLVIVLNSVHRILLYLPFGEAGLEPSKIFNCSLVTLSLSLSLSVQRCWLKTSLRSWPATFPLTSHQ